MSIAKEKNVNSVNSDGAKNGGSFAKCVICLWKKIFIQNLKKERHKRWKGHIYQKQGKD